MSSEMINILLSSFSGLGLPPTLCLPVPGSSSISDFTSILAHRIPDIHNRLILTTNSNKRVSTNSSAALSTLVDAREDVMLPLRLTVPLCGGKGGFGSQLRAAGGRMSSRKKKNQGDTNGWSRNLDGRRLRTVNEAKALAEYLAVKPEMERTEKEERRKRWQHVLDTTEARMDEIKTGGRNVRVDGKWVEAKEEAAEKTREAAIAACKAGYVKDILKESDSSPSGSGASEGSESDIEAEGSSGSNSTAPPKIYGWDEDDEFMSSDDEDEVMKAETEPSYEGKGKAKA